jgi:predicted RND superfamily exporter protein
MKQNKETFLHKAVEKYAHFMSLYPMIIIIICALLFGSAVYYSGKVQTKSMDYAGMLPEGYEVITANNLFTDSFGTTDTARFVIEIDNKYFNSLEPIDIREPEVLEFAEKLKDYMKSSQDVLDITSPSDILREMHSGNLPKSKTVIRSDILNNPLLQNYISKDGTLMILDIRLNAGYDAERLTKDMQDAMEFVTIPAGIKVDMAGGAIEDTVVNSLLGDDMAKTGAFSMGAIILILLFTFGSIKYGFLPLTTIIVGVMWTQGFIGATGIKMSSATSGVMSMIMGIGIDFGIQIITRFRQELKEGNGIEKSMTITLENVLLPMITTTLAAVLGFQAMGMGELTFMAEMGDMMMYGVIFCFLAAITFVPALTVIVEKLSHKIKSIKNR